MWNAKKKLDALNRKNEGAHKDYQSKNDKLIKEYSDKKDEYNDIINIINSEKIAMRDEIRQLYNFLTFIGGSLNRKISIFDFVKENPAPNIDANVEEKLDRVEPEVPNNLLNNAINSRRAKDFETKIYYKKLDYKHNLGKKQVLTQKMEDGTEIADLYMRILATVRDAVKQKVIPEFEYIKAFLMADAIREKVCLNQIDGDVKTASILEYQDTKYDMHYQFVKNAFDFWDLCQAFFSKSILTDLMSQEEVTVEQKRDFEDSISAIQDKLGDLEKNMEVK